MSIVHGANRTRGLLLRRQPLYPSELRELKSYKGVKFNALIAIFSRIERGRFNKKIKQNLDYY